MTLMLGITDLHDGMILSTLSVSSRDFVFGFPKRPRTNGDVFFAYKLVIVPLISQCGCEIPHRLERRTKYSLRVWKPLPNKCVLKP